MTRGEHDFAEDFDPDFPNHPGPKCGCNDCMDLSEMEAEWRIEHEKVHNHGA